MENICGLIVEYNPLHNGHIYHINKAKELIDPTITIAVMSGNFTQRGEPAIVDKFIRTKHALHHGIDLVVELPFLFATQSADYFSRGALYLLNQLQCNHLVFGSETKDFHQSLPIVKEIVKHKDIFDQHVNKIMASGTTNYPNACNQALKKLGFMNISSPNDLLGYSYMKEIVSNQYEITPHSILRTHPYHDISLQKNITSASGIRHSLLQEINMSMYTPMYNELQADLYYLENYFDLLKYRLLTVSKEHLATIHLINEGIENKMIAEIINASTMEEFINTMTCKRYTRVRIQRTILYILLDITKDAIKDISLPSYIRVLGMSQSGKKYLHTMKHHTSIPIITRFAQIQDPLLAIEYKATCLYHSILKDPKRNNKIKEEFQQPVIIAKK